MAEFRRAVYLVLSDALGDVADCVTEQHDGVDVVFDVEDPDELVEASVVVLDRHQWLAWRRFQAEHEHDQDGDDAEVVAVE
jgi:hypothetical protein